MKLYLFLSLGIALWPSLAFSQTALYFRFTSSGLPDEPALSIIVTNPSTKETRRYTVKEGQTFFGYQIKRFQEKIEERTNPRTGVQEQIDRSIISLYDPLTKSTSILEYEKPKEIMVRDEDLPPPRVPGKTQPCVPANPLQHQTFVVVSHGEHARRPVMPHAGPHEL